MQISPRAVRAARVAVTAGLASATTAMAGGSPENVLLIVNPTAIESMYLADYYKNARNIPERNVVYIDPGAPSYAAFAAANGNIDAVFGVLRNARITDHIDYVVVADTDRFFVSAPGLISDGCFPVTRFSQSSVYTLAFIRSQILVGMPSTAGNQYYQPDPNLPRAFSTRTGWLAGNPSSAAGSAKYFVGASLGYTGSLGNSLPELLAMIDRSVAADGTRPAGTFYYMNTTDALRNVRAPHFPAAVSAITSRGGAAMILNDVLPDGRTDALGVMTGWAAPDIDGSTMALRPGAFCDHLTSWAAMFDVGSQTKVSAWIRRGASGSAGEVEEPCNYNGKFPAPNLHAFYFQGLSLGEAYLRSLQYVPFQGLFIGDPLTRPYATLPMVSATPPAGTVSGLASFTPSASTTLPGAAIGGVDLYVDGIYLRTRHAGQPFQINTPALADGWHELRLLANDNTPVKTTGRWVGSITTDNAGRSVGCNLGTSSGNLDTLFQATVTAAGGPVREVRLLHNGRVVAASATSPAVLSAYGRNLGAGQGRVQAEAEYTDGRIARSAPASINIAYTAGTPTGPSPVAYSYTKRVARGGPFVVELPARYDSALADASYAIVTPPAQSTVGGGTLPYRVMTAPATACGPDTFTFRVTTPAGTSNTATVTLIYGSDVACIADLNGDGQSNVNDFISYQAAFAAGDLRADVDGSCALNVNDFVAFTGRFAEGCP